MSIPVDTTFLDTNVYIKLEEELATESTLSILYNKDRKGIPFLSLNSGSIIDRYPQKKTEWDKFGQDVSEVAEWYDFLNGSNVILTKGVQKQLQYKTDAFITLEDFIGDRMHEYLFLQIDGKFGSELRQQANDSLPLLLPYKKMISFMNKLLESSPHQESQYLEHIVDYVGAVSHFLGIPGDEQKYDAFVDQKLVAAVLDNAIVKRRKTALLSNDLAVGKLTQASYLLFKTAHSIIPPDFLEGALEIYWFDNRDTRKFQKKEYPQHWGEVKKLVLGNTNLDENKGLSGHLAAHLLKLTEELGV